VKGRAVVVAALVLAVAGCDGADTPTTEPAAGVPDVISVTSDVLVDGGSIPRRFTCDGAGESPPLAWSGVPPEAGALALVVDDPDAPGGTFVHWLVLDVPVADDHVNEGAGPPAGVPVPNSAGSGAYSPPCPPSGTHHYRFTVYALSRPTRPSAKIGLDEALAAIDDVAIGRGRLTASYTRAG
jgi:Raf kinase inhibitor-like YbhB/YbcL family protein